MIPVVAEGRVHAIGRKAALSLPAVLFALKLAQLHHQLLPALLERPEHLVVGDSVHRKTRVAFKVLDRLLRVPSERAVRQFKQPARLKQHQLQLRHLRTLVSALKVGPRRGRGHQAQRQHQAQYAHRSLHLSFPPSSSFPCVPRTPSGAAYAPSLSTGQGPCSCPTGPACGLRAGAASPVRISRLCGAQPVLPPLRHPARGHPAASRRYAPISPLFYALFRPLSTPIRPKWT